VEADREAGVRFAEVLDLHEELPSLVLDGAVHPDDHPIGLASGMVAHPAPGRPLEWRVPAPIALALIALTAPVAAEGLVDLVRPIVGTARKDQAIGAVNRG
jgi:hypothetical protein